MALVAGWNRRRHRHIRQIMRRSSRTKTSDTSARNLALWALLVTYAQIMNFSNGMPNRTATHANHLRV